MISVISPQYVKSGICAQEVKSFYDSAEQKGGLWVNNHARIFKAVKTHVPRLTQPEELQNISDYEFFPELGAEASRNFWMKLEDIAYDIYQVLDNLKKGETTGEQLRNVTNRPVLYLAEGTHDLNSHRERIKRQLQQRGFVILPDRPLNLNANDIQTQISTDLQSCNYSVHLVGENYGIVPEGETRSVAEIQHQLALERSQTNGFFRLIWMPPGLNSQDDRQKTFIHSLKTDPSALTNADLLQTSLEEFKTYLVDKLNEEPHITQSVPNTDAIIRVYLQCDQKDIDDTATLEEYLFDQGFEVKLPAFEGDELEVFEVHKENLLLCDATIIYYGQASDSWLSTKLADLQKISGYGRKTPMKAKAIFIAGPETKHKHRFRTREALTIKNFEEFSPDELAEFLVTLTGREGAQ